MFLEPKYTDYIKISLLSGFKLFDFVFKMVEMQFWAIISNTLKLFSFLHLKSHIDLTHRKTLILSDYVLVSAV